MSPCDPLPLLLLPLLLPSSSLSSSERKVSSPSGGRDSSGTEAKLTVVRSSLRAFSLSYCRLRSLSSANAQEMYLVVRCRPSSSMNPWEGEKCFITFKRGRCSHRHSGVHFLLMPAFACVSSTSLPGPSRAYGCSLTGLLPRHPQLLRPQAYRRVFSIAILNVCLLCETCFARDLQVVQLMPGPNLIFHVPPVAGSGLGHK